MISKQQKDFLIFILECLIGIVIGFLIYRVYPVIGAWCLFSIILVLAPDRNDAMKIATNRIKANLIGALVGLSLCYFHPISLPIICIGVAVAMLICEWLKLSSVTKSAIVAMLIVTMHEPGKFFWNVGLERAGGVMLGCVIGVVITYIFHITRKHSSQAIHIIKNKYQKK